MGLGLLPIEKIPIFIWGLLLMAIGIVLSLDNEFFSLAQLEDAAMILLGAIAVVYDVRKRFFLAKDKEEK